MKKTLIISNDSKIKLLNNNILIENSKGSFDESLESIGLIILDQNSTITTNLINELTTNNISIIVYNKKKLPSSFIIPFYGSINRYRNISKQLKWSTKLKKMITLKIIKNKIKNQENVINEIFMIQNEYKDYLDDINVVNMSKSEAFVARKYFYLLFGTKFNRRDYEDPINHKLNYGYAILAATITTEILSHGYLTELGINHCSKTNNFNLTYDLIEPFRQIVDRYVYKTRELIFDNTYKSSLVELLYLKVRYNGKEYSVLNAIKEYVLSIFKSFETKSENEVGCIEII